MLESGILLLAIGHPYYGRMAYNLAMSIKAIDKNVNITLVYTETAIAHINQRNIWVFDNKMQIDNTSQPFGAKLLLDKLTPYERTLYIDVDTLCVNKQSPARLLEQLKGIQFTGITEGFHNYEEPSKSEHGKNYFFWADLDEIEKMYGVTKIYQWRSEFIYFENTKYIKDTFACARDVYASPPKSTGKFAGHTPDELGFNVACALAGIEPHQYKWKPTYWDRLHGGVMPTINELQYMYYVISCGSNASGGALKRVYDRVCAASAYKLGLQHVFPLINKKEMLLNRQLM